MSDPISVPPAEALRLIENFNRALWEMVDSDACPFHQPMRQSTRERIERALAGNRDLSATILRRFFEK